MDRLFDRFTASFGVAPFPAFAFESQFDVPSPAADISEDDTSFKFSAELPGMSEKDIEAAVSGNTLTIKGEKRQEREESKQDFHLTERSYGEFRRSFTLPEGVDGAKIAAVFGNGVVPATACLPRRR
jgi:HSP20 family protein